jgi:hypothetical protein
MLELQREEDKQERETGGEITRHEATRATG